MLLLRKSFFLANSSHLTLKTVQKVKFGVCIAVLLVEINQKSWFMFCFLRWQCCHLSLTCLRPNLSAWPPATTFPSPEYLSTLFLLLPSPPGKIRDSLLDQITKECSKVLKSFQALRQVPAGSQKYTNLHHCWLPFFHRNLHTNSLSAVSILLLSTSASNSLAYTISLVLTLAVSLSLFTSQLLCTNFYLSSSQELSSHFVRLFPPIFHFALHFLFFLLFPFLFVWMQG